MRCVRCTEAVSITLLGLAVDLRAYQLALGLRRLHGPQPSQVPGASHLYLYGLLKTSEPICVIFGTLQHCFALNTSVHSILNRFITSVAPPSDQINNSVFHLQNQVRPLYSNVHVFKIPVPIFTIFWHLPFAASDEQLPRVRDTSDRNG